MKNKQKNQNGVQHSLDVNVPNHWEVVPLEMVLDDIVGGGTPSRANLSYWEGSIPWLTIKDMRTHRPADAIDHITDAAVRESSTNVIPADTVIIATRIGLGKVIRVPYDAAINQDLKALFNKPEIDKGYLEYWIISIADYLESIGSGTTVKGIRLEQLRSLPFPLAPLEQQKRIVAEIEKQFSRLDEAVANLKRVKANLKRYKAAVLKAAVEGKLTEEWREQHPDVEPASKLLERILAERRKQWNRKGKYKEPPEPDTTDLPILPVGWVWATTSQILREVKDGTHDTPKYHECGIPFITQKHVKAAGFVFEDFKRISLEDHQHFFKRSDPARGDILVSMIGVNRGESCIINTDEIFSIKNVGLFKPDHKTSSVSYIQYYLSSSLGQRLLLRGSKGGAQPFVGLTELRNWPLPVAPLEEQQSIVAAVDRCFSLFREVEAQVDDNLKRAERLRQSILAKAFSGGLVAC